ncbi:MAG: pilus assembly protein PilM [Planctomycetota bacterium]
MPGRTRAKNILAFDWDSRTLRVVHATVGKRAPKIDRVFAVAIPKNVDVNHAEQMGKFLRQALEQEGISAAHAIVDIPRDQATFNTLTLPCQPLNELPSIVAIQIAKYLPYAVGEAIVDFAVGPHESGAPTAEVVVAAVRREVVTHCEAVFSAAGLKLDRVGLRPSANRVAACELLRHALPGRVLFIDIRPTLTEINVLRDGFLVFSRAASVLISEPEASPAQDRSEIKEPPVLTLVGADLEFPSSSAIASPTGPPSVVSSLVVEVTRSIEAYRATEPGAKMDHAIIGGDLGVEESLAETLQQRLGITTEIYNPASSFGWEPDEGRAASAFAASLGLVIGYTQEDGLQFDFLNPKRTITTTERRLRKVPLIAATVLLFVFAAGIGFAAMTKPSRDRLAAMDGQIKKLQDRTKDNEKFLALVQEVKSFDQGQHIWVDVLYDVIGNLPSQEEMVVSQIDVNQKDEKVVFRTRAKKRDTATEAVRALSSFRRDGRELPRFKVSIRTQTEKPGESYPFLQDMQIKILADEGKSKGGSKTDPSGGA